MVWWEGERQRPAPSPPPAGRPAPFLLYKTFFRALLCFFTAAAAAAQFLRPNSALCQVFSSPSRGPPALLSPCLLVQKDLMNKLYFPKGLGVKKMKATLLWGPIKRLGERRPVGRGGCNGTRARARASHGTHSSRARAGKQPPAWRLTRAKGGRGGGGGACRAALPSRNRVVVCARRRARALRPAGRPLQRVGRTSWCMRCG